MSPSFCTSAINDDGSNGGFLANEMVLRSGPASTLMTPLGFATSRQQARQLVTHGHITVNGRKTNIPSFTVKPGEKISVRPESRRRPYFKNLFDSGELNRRNVPDWLRLSAADLAGEVVTMPRREDGEPEINEQLIVEYYSR